MLSTRGRSSQFIARALLLLALGALPAHGQLPRSVTVSEGTLRKYALKAVLPEFPEPARKRGVQGVAVAQLDVDAAGLVKQAAVLEAPDALIREAVATAVRQWQFKPATIGGKAVPIRGKLTFYFVIENGKGMVKSPAQLAQNGPAPS